MADTIYQIHYRAKAGRCGDSTLVAQKTFQSRDVTKLTAWQRDVESRHPLPPGHEVNVLNKGVSGFINNVPDHERDPPKSAEVSLNERAGSGSGTNPDHPLGNATSGN